MANAVRTCSVGSIFWDVLPSSSEFGVQVAMGFDYTNFWG